MIEQNESQQAEQAPAQEQSSVPVFVPPPVQDKPLGRIYSMPDPVETYMTENECNDGIKKVMADVSADPRHPLMNKSHPMHKDYQKHFTSLHELRAQITKAKPTKFDKMLEVQKEKEATAQTKRYKDACADDKKIKSLGFAGKEVPFNIGPGEARCLRMQLLNAQAGENELLRLDSMIHADARKFRDNATIQTFYETYCAARHGDAKKSVANELLFFLRDAYVKREKKQKNSKIFGG